MGDYKVDLCVLMQAGLSLSAGSQSLLGYNFMLSLWLYLIELEGRERNGMSITETTTTATATGTTTTTTTRPDKTRRHNLS